MRKQKNTFFWRMKHIYIHISVAISQNKCIWQWDICVPNISENHVTFWISKTMHEIAKEMRIKERKLGNFYALPICDILNTFFSFGRHIFKKVADILWHNVKNNLDFVLLIYVSWGCSDYCILFLFRDRLYFLLSDIEQREGF